MLEDASDLPDVSAIYRTRFGDAGLERRDRVWKILCRDYFDRLFVADGSVLDLACGYGEFINNVNVAQKHAVDANADAAGHLAPGVEFRQTMANNLAHLADNSLDRAFTSNFLEHLPSKAACDEVLREVLRVLKPGGRFVIMGPNIRFAYREYWDFYDHYLPLSDRSLVEGLRTNGYEIESVVDRFLPFTMAGKQPTADWLIRTYLALPMAWRFLGKQFLVVAAKP
jgi:SAM-dependent methyltransferase